MILKQNKASKRGFSRVEEMYFYWRYSRETACLALAIVKSQLDFYVKQTNKQEKFLI